MVTPTTVLPRREAIDMKPPQLIFTRYEGITDIVNGCFEKYFVGFPTFYLINRNGDVYKGYRKGVSIQQGLSDIIKIICDEHCLALDKHGNVFSFGKNDFGQLGSGNTLDSNDPILVADLTDILDIAIGNKRSFVLTRSGEVYMFGREIGSTNRILNPTLIEGLKDIIQISAGSYHLAAVDINGQVYTVGYNQKGQLGFPITGDYIKSALPVNGLNVFN